MEYKLIIVLILLITIYALYYTKKNFNLIIALSLLLIFVLNGVINDKELFTDNSSLLELQSLFESTFNQSNNIDNLENNLDLLETVVEEKLLEQEDVNYPIIEICSSEPLVNIPVSGNYSSNLRNQTRTTQVPTTQVPTTQKLSNSCDCYECGGNTVNNTYNNCEKAQSTCGPQRDGEGCYSKCGPNETCHCKLKICMAKPITKPQIHHVSPDPNFSGIGF